MLQEMEKNLVLFQGRDQKKEALRLLDLEITHVLFDELVQRAWRCLPSGSNGASSTSVSTSSPTATATNSKMVSNSSMNRTHAFHTEREVRQSTELFTRDDSYVKKVKSTMYSDGITLD